MVKVNSPPAVLSFGESMNSGARGSVAAASSLSSGNRIVNNSFSIGDNSAMYSWASACLGFLTTKRASYSTTMPAARRSFDANFP